MKLILAALPLVFAASAMAMPHDQPKLNYFSNETLSVGLVFSDGADMSSDVSAHRLLKEVYVCHDGKKIADFANYKTVVDSSGYLIIGKDKLGGVIKIEKSADMLTIIESTLPKLKGVETDGVELKLALSGINGFELDWSNPCAPKSIDN
jgi:hypothetical protein